MQIVDVEVPKLGRIVNENWIENVFIFIQTSRLEILLKIRIRWFTSGTICAAEQNHKLEIRFS